MGSKSRGTHALGDTLGNDGNGLDLGVLHQLHGRAVDTARGRKVDDNVHIRVLGHGLINSLVDGQERLAGSPVHLADELTTEGVDDASYRGCLALADEVEVEHALHGTRLEAAEGDILVRSRILLA